MNRSAGRTPKGGHRPLEILIVDDDGESVARIRELIACGCGISANVTHASSVEDAFRRLEADGVDLCLADYRLSHKGDFRFFAETGNRAHTALVFLADEERKEWVYSALRHGAQDCLRKDRLDPYEMAKSLAFALYHKNREMELTAAALRDPLTGLGNRALFVEQIDILLEQARRNREQLAVLFMDVDGLKPINDTLGHSVGDQLLKQVAERIKGSTRKSDVLARLGGDEFAAVLPGIASAQSVSQVVQTLADAVESDPYCIDAHSIRIGLSCGAAIFPTDGQSVDELLHLADTRMYAVKARRRNAKAAPPPPSSPPLNMSWFGKDAD
ncbi:diguanylate cyclase domain-containing protein [Magnetospirillum sp. XM-1]|uniref:diguanylate cyclase domain-containing protein n=1 Tax=Magnetospirillum sp. XM-1 TaxID=1663591 RepID=UPI0008390D80|nr:diguanylate cyclase [Magnetospirillum sp. XM-1]